MVPKTVRPCATSKATNGPVGAGRGTGGAGCGAGGAAAGVAAWARTRARASSCMETSLRTRILAARGCTPTMGVLECP